MGLMSSRPAKEEVATEENSHEEEHEEKKEDQNTKQNKNKDKEENLTIQYPPQEKKFYEDAQKLRGEPDEAALDRKGKKRKSRTKIMVIKTIIQKIQKIQIKMRITMKIIKNKGFVLRI